MLRTALLVAIVLLLALLPTPAPLHATFIRSDTNSDTTVDISDPILTLLYLFSGGVAGCLDAADSNDDGTVDISDAILTLAFLFSGSAAPPVPFPACGEDPTADALGCASPPVGGPCSPPPAPPAAPAIVQPFSEGQITGTFEMLFQTDPDDYHDPNGDPWESTQWLIRTVSGGATVWESGFVSSPLLRNAIALSEGNFVGSLSGQTELLVNTAYELVVRYRDTASFVSAESVRGFVTAAVGQPVPGVGPWLVRPGYAVQTVQSGLRLPIALAVVSDPGPDPADPLYYIAERYGEIQVVRNDGARQAFATGLLDYNPQGPIPGSGEQGIGGIAVERDGVNPAIYHLYVTMLWDNGSPPGGPNHYPKLERMDSVAGGLSLATRTVLLNMQPETQGQSHHISSVSIGPDGKLYVQMGDGFNATTALNLDQYRGKVLRMNKVGTPVTPGDPAGGNPFYSALDGITSRDYIHSYGHRNPFGGAWRAVDGRLWIVDQGNAIDRLVDLTSGQSYGWAGNDSALVAFSKHIWDPATVPMAIDFVEAAQFSGSGFPAEAFGHAYASLAGSTYAAGPQQRTKAIVEFPDLDTLDLNGKLAMPQSTLVRYNGAGRSTIAALAAAPEGLLFSDLYEETGTEGATAPGANILLVRALDGAGRH